MVALLFTPFTADGRRFDAASMRRQLDFVLESGVSAVVACGKAGEFEGQSLEEIEEVLTTVLEHVHGRIPVGWASSAWRRIAACRPRNLPPAAAPTSP